MMTKISLISGPALRAVTIPEFKDWARIDHTDDDGTVIPRILDTAIDAAEQFLWRKLITQTWDEYFDDFDDPLVLRYAPVQSVTTVTYYDSNGTLQTLSTDIWELGEEHHRSVVRRKYNQNWPSVRLHEDQVIVRYICGYGLTSSTVPAEIRTAICIHAAWEYRNREGDLLPFPDTFRRKLRHYSLRGWTKIGA